ncbi:MAG: hypothetical protein AB7F59_09310 [Bdellovibrionales bacterium]
MKISQGVKRQLWISFWVVFVWAVTTLIVLREQIQQVVMGAGQEDVAPADAKEFSELTWEILVVDPQLRTKLWAKYEQSNLQEKENAYKAVVHMLEGIPPEQAQHLVEQMLARSGDTSSRSHRQKLYEMLERMITRHKPVIRIIAHYATKNLESHVAITKKIDIKKMMDNIEFEIQDTPYKYCLEGKDEEIGRCTQQLAKGQHPSALDHIKNFFKGEKTISQRSEVLIALAKNKVSYGKEHIPHLLKSGNPMELKLALRLIREYGLTDYIAGLRELQNRAPETISQDLESTISYLLTTRKTAGE